MLRCVLLLLALLATVSVAWPGMRSSRAAEVDASSSGGIIGPPCTVGAHNSFPEAIAGPCPDTPQPPPPPHTNKTKTHTWPSAFTYNWTFTFVPDASDKPPYPASGPTSPHNVTTGRTFYMDDGAGVRRMVEQYDSYCIPVFAPPNVSMAGENHYSCQFINNYGPGQDNTSWVRCEVARLFCVALRAFAS